ncbi:terminase large subunit, partial [bacterium]|nr:terminase large subunit [bacterium]
AVALLELEKRAASPFFRYFPNGGPLSREFYPKHIALMDAGADFRERVFLAANRVGKTDTGCYELVCHLTGLYPEWWTGRRFPGPIRAWAAGDTGKTVRDIIQSTLLGPKDNPNKRMLPEHLVIGKPKLKAGIPDAVETIEVRHASGGTSVCVLKSYDQRREAFQGTSQHFILLDEEPPEDIHTECLLRTMDTPDMLGGGLMLLTFTPLQGMTPLILQLLPGGAIDSLETANDSVSVIQASWDDAPHLSPQARAELWASIPPYQRDARSKGIPQLGSGAVYQVAESEITVADFQIPKHWKRCFSMDAGGGAKPTAATWFAEDPESHVWYLYSVHKGNSAEPVVHANAIKARGSWIPGVGDCAALIMLEHDAAQLISTYQSLGLDLELPDKAVETGVYDVWTMLSAGLLKVFASCKAFFEEYRLYRRDEKGRIVKQNDHVMDATRYGVHSGLARAKVQPVPPKPEVVTAFPDRDGLSWMA